MMSKVRKNAISKKPDALFERVVQILEQARGNVARAVNSNMVLAYWLIGREIVEAVQGGKGRAEYGQQVLEQLSERLTQRYGSGYSITNLRYFRLFYQMYEDRLNVIHHKPGDELAGAGSRLAIHHKVCDESAMGFSPLLSWSHYRALLRIEDAEARLFYEHETAECGWSTTQLERQIQSFYYQRIVANRGKAGLKVAGRKQLVGEPMPAAGFLKSPFVLEFLGLPDTPELHEDKLEQSIINNLQKFLLELGKGFSFVARQKHVRFDDDDFYIDLVFYNYLAKCFLLIELKIGKLTHRDVGQMDGYVRMYDEMFRVKGDNPTVGLILCSDKGEAVAKYSVLRESRQVFASQYMPFLPTEDQLRQEVEKERKAIETAWEERRG